MVGVVGNARHSVNAAGAVLHFCLASSYPCMLSISASIIAVIVQ